jgi:hypothetical protein
MNRTWLSGYVAGAGCTMIGWGTTLSLDGKPFGYALLGVGIVGYFASYLMTQPES